MLNQRPIISESFPVVTETTPAISRFDAGHNSLQVRSALFRGTSATKAYRALADLPEVQRQGERFLQLVSPDPTTGCHIWAGCFDPKSGYGQFKVWPAKIVVMAHRFAWVLANNLVIPERHDVDHICLNRWCVNPPHLAPITHAKNLQTRRHNTAPARAALAARRLRLEAA